MTGEPSPKGERDENGRFVAGAYKGGPGNPHAAKVGQYRKAIWEAVSTDDVKDVIRAMVDEAKAGDVAAAKVVLERVAGQPPKDAEDTADDVLNLAQFLRQFLTQARETVTGQQQEPPQ